MIGKHRTEHDTYDEGHTVITDAGHEYVCQHGEFTTRISCACEIVVTSIFESQARRGWERKHAAKIAS